MAKQSVPPEKILTLLKTNPLTIAERTAELTPQQMRAIPMKGEWSAAEVLAHLRSCADVWGDCIATILAEDRPTIRAVNPTTWIVSTDYLDLEFHPSFQAFATQRAELVALLESLAHEGWLRGATVTGAGKPLERTVQFYAQWLAEHERSHLRQFRRLVNATMRK